MCAVVAETELKDESLNRTAQKPSDDVEMASRSCVANMALRFIHVFWLYYTYVAAVWQKENQPQ